MPRVRRSVNLLLVALAEACPKATNPDLLEVLITIRIESNYILPYPGVQILDIKFLGNMICANKMASHFAPGSPLKIRQLSYFSIIWQALSKTH